MNTKKNATFLFIISMAIMALCLIPCILYAFPSTVNYQGYLSNKAGTKVDGSINMFFKIYDVETYGEPLWKEEHFAVPIDAGHFEVKLGSQNGSDLSQLPSNKNLYLSINIGGEETTERVKLDTVIHAIFSKYSLEAQTVALNSIMPEHIQNKAITNEKIADNAVNTNQIANTSITNNKIADKTITANKINDGSGSNLNADLLDGKDSSDFVLKTEAESLNKGTTVQLIAGEKINGTETPIPVYIRKDGLIIEQSVGSSNSDVFGVNKYAQTFQTDVSTTEIKSISLNLEKNGNPSGNIEVAIYEVESNIPKVTSIKSKSINGNDVSNGWNEFIFDSFVSVSPLTTYAIVLSLPSGDATNNVKWKYISSNAYNKGCYLLSTNYGTTWDTYDDRDFTFKLYSSGRVYLCAADDLEKLNFIGFAINDADVGETITVQTNGIVGGFDKALNIGKNYYIQNNAGKIGTIPGKYMKLVAIAINDSEITIFWANIMEIATIEDAISGNDDRKIMTPLKTKQAIFNSPILSGTKNIHISTNGDFSDMKTVEIGFRAKSIRIFGSFNYCDYYSSINKSGHGEWVSNGQAGFVENNYVENSIFSHASNNCRVTLKITNVTDTSFDIYYSGKSYSNGGGANASYNVRWFAD